jgi:hypothetical protein
MLVSIDRKTSALAAVLHGHHNYLGRDARAIGQAGHCQARSVVPKPRIYRDPSWTLVMRAGDGVFGLAFVTSNQ